MREPEKRVNQNNGEISSAQVIFPDKKTLDEIVSDMLKEIADIKSTLQKGSG